MSKIEDALKKAKAHKNGILDIPSNKTEPVHSPAAVGTGRAVSVMNQSSSALIKLMKEEALAEDDDLIRKGIILPDSGRTKVTDSFRYLRTQLLQKSQNSNFIVLVTSCDDEGDSSFVSMNMAAAFAFDESKTSLVVDCDIKSHKIEDTLGIEYEHSLLDFLEDTSIEVSDILKDVGVKRLRVIPSGKRDHIESEYFSLERMRTLLDGLVERYSDRYIVLNSPAISGSVDTSILIELVDYVVVVAPYGTVTHDKLEKTLQRIDKSKLIGVILNDIPEWS